MKHYTLYKICNYDRLFGGYDWSITPHRGDLITSTPYEVEVPDDFYLAETVNGETMFFREGCDRAYTLTIGRNAEGGEPYLISSNGNETIKLRVIREIKAK
ncbi:MAG: hypothetical protein LIO54_03580 [Oscillospiraceae bacterium]|nr:hypothetical protein [Oscillospiraceae bacterium]